MRFDRHGFLRFTVAKPVWLVSAFAKLAALAADLLILRPTVSFLSRAGSAADLFTGSAD
jgi:hypothetical protein